MQILSGSTRNITWCLLGLLEPVILPKVAGVEMLAGCRGVQNRVVEQVEGLRAEAAAQAFAHGELLFEGRVQFMEAGRGSNELAKVAPGLRGRDLAARPQSRRSHELRMAFQWLIRRV